MRPSARLVKLATGLCAAALAVSAGRIWLPELQPPLVMLWWTAGAALLGGMLLDALTGYRVPGLDGNRQLARNLALGVRSTVTLEMENLGERRLRLETCDQVPPQLAAAGLPREVELQPGQAARVEYPVTPQRRGQARFGRIEALVSSPWGLWQKKVTLGEPTSARVYPDFLGVSSLQALSTEQSLRYLGLNQQQRRGEGMDFHQLREYRRGDSQRQVDWRASARLRRLISREYQDERDQQIIYLLDCGRRMRARDDGYSHFDHALNALLLSAYVAVRQGDAVGLQAFATGNGQRRARLAPTRGDDSINLLLNHVYDLHTSTAHSDYSTAARELMESQQKRALVVLVTNLRDEDSDELLAAVELLSRRHLVMVASLRERALDELVRSPVEEFPAALEHLATVDLVQRRQRLLQHLRARNVIVADARPERMHLALVENYWRLKRSGRL
ncbi:Uncharacterized conserved protein, DUF58 family, contains vWF domain [Microbulbifer yueqingensis]|uniref:Uncharacterized conserved protein, DUF58 family, contains vWF domain n=2 Tax=Microbulbifer yueqingensis TaxID=658219 RepID=A0A1G9DDP1_9GAMM|nr:Uncharacterized conserved protein, DUF58 family, contains vWF domain [Microbulbifer yueqingensis]